MCKATAAVTGDLWNLRPTTPWYFLKQDHLLDQQKPGVFPKQQDMVGGRPIKCNMYIFQWPYPWAKTSKKERPLSRCVERPPLPPTRFPWPKKTRTKQGECSTVERRWIYKGWRLLSPTAFDSHKCHPLEIESGSSGKRFLEIWEKLKSCWCMNWQADAWGGKLLKWNMLLFREVHSDVCWEAEHLVRL